MLSCPAFTERCAGAGEFIFSLTKHGAMLTERRPGSNSGGGANSICVKCGKRRAGCHLIKPEDLVWRPSRLLHEAGFQTDGHAVHLAVNLVIAIHQADGFGLRATLDYLVAAAQFQILDQDNTIAVREHVAMGILDDARNFRCIRLGFARPLVTAGDAFPFFRKY
jgi:hypothetical protein